MVILDVPSGTEAAAALFLGSSCYIVVPADPEYRAEALRLCASEYSPDRGRGAAMLVNYPDAETLAVLEALLRDGWASCWIGETGEVTKITFPVRKAAYEALVGLGRRVEKPLVEREPTREERYSELLTMARRHIDEEILHAPGTSADWPLDIHREGDSWVVEIPLEIVKRQPGDVPPVLYISVSTHEVTAP
jgi:hypothetical protein